MCGIVYAKHFDGTPVAEYVKARYKKQRNRGTDGFGFYSPDENQLFHNPRETRAIKGLLDNTGKEILFHHRFPTSTANVRNACHPFSTKDTFGDTEYILVHNGVIYNDKELKRGHDKKDIEYISQMDKNTFNDSEALLYDVALYLEGKQSELKAKGRIAFVMIKKVNGEPHSLYFGRNFGSPLKMIRDENRLVLASEGKGESIPTDTLYRYDYGDDKLHKSDLKIPERTRTTYRTNTSYLPKRTYSNSGQSNTWQNSYQSNGKKENRGFGFQPIGKSKDESEHKFSESSLNQTAKQMATEYLRVTNRDYFQAIELCETDIRVQESRMQKLRSRADDGILRGEELDEWVGYLRATKVNERAIRLLEQWFEEAYYEAM